MSKSIFVNEYNKLYVIENDKIVITDTLSVNYIDLLSNREIEVNVNSYNDCLCKDKNHLSDYYKNCNKCDGQGYVNLNGHKLICNECRGNKYIRVHDCYLCNNRGKIISKSLLKLKLKDTYKDGEELIFEYKDYILKLILRIADKDDYLIKGNDIYFLRGINYSREDYKNKISKSINTISGNKYVSSEFKVKREVVKLEGSGLNGGDFYFIFDNDVENEKRELYVNVLLDKSGYALKEDLVDNDYVILKDNVALNDNSIYIDENINEYEDDEYRINFNKLNKNDYIIEDNKLVYLLYLDKEDLNNDKKIVCINEEKIIVNFKKNLKEEEYIVVNKVLINKEGKKDNLTIKVIPYFENIYKISIKKNKNSIYIDDYKYSDYTLVETYKSSDYLENYIRVNDEEKIYVNNDVVYIKRV